MLGVLLSLPCGGYHEPRSVQIHHAMYASESPRSLDQAHVSIVQPSLAQIEISEPACWAFLSLHPAAPTMNLKACIFLQQGTSEIVLNSAIKHMCISSEYPLSRPRSGGPTVEHPTLPQVR